MAEISREKDTMNPTNELIFGLALAAGIFALGLIARAWVRRSRRLVATFTIDTTNASMPEGWKKDGWGVEEHRGLGIVEVRFAGGEMYINGRKVGEYLAKKQKRGGIDGYDLRMELADKPTLPDPLLGLLIHEQGTPAVGAFLQKYKNRFPFFWGTIYRGLGGGLCVRYLNGVGDRFIRDTCWLDCGWGPAGPALVLEPEAESSK